MNARSIFVTGTDTGVGKTLVAAALIDVLARRGLRTVGMKPVASGGRMTGDGLRSDDALALIGHANVAIPYALVNPYCFEPAIAPHIAAAAVKTRIDLKVLLAAHTGLTTRADAIVVEGAGGWFTPLNESETLADFARAIDARVVMVVGMRLGCINHALLTAQAIRAGGLELAGWIANAIDPQMPKLTENIASLENRLSAPLLAAIPHRADWTSAQIAAECGMEPKIAALLLNDAAESGVNSSKR